MAESNKPPLVVYIVWHPNFGDGKDYADCLYSCLTRDVSNPVSRGLGIPVYFRNAISAEAGGPLPIPLNDAEHTAIVALIDDKMIVDNEWKSYLSDLRRLTEVADSPHRLFPVSISPHAFNLDILSQINHIRIHDKNPWEKNSFLANSLIHELCRLLLNHDRVSVSRLSPSSPSPVKLFVSHSKRDGVDIAQKIMKYVLFETPLKTFFDAVDIPPGDEFWTKIQNEIEGNSLLVIQSDSFASSFWCRSEVICAKRFECPIVVVNAVSDGEERSFPYLGNVPTIRWDETRHSNDMDSVEENIQRIIDTMLNEVLRITYSKQFLKYSAQLFNIPQKALLVPKPPELMSLSNIEEAVQCCPERLIIYPDPPLGNDECDLLREFAPGLEFQTPVYCRRIKMTTEKKADASSERQPFLNGKTIGISISDSPDLEQRGFGKMHIQDAMVEFARYLLAGGATLAYGGDLRSGGFTHVLFDLVKTHNRDGKSACEKIINFHAWPIHLQLTDKEVAKFMKVADFRPLDPPPFIGVDTEKFLPPDSTENRYVWAHCLTAMRENMSRSIDVRLLMGGQITGYKGKYPGLVEEAYLALRDNMPLFLIGAFGGCTYAVIQALKGRHPEALTLEKQTEGNPDYGPLVKHFNSHLDNVPEPYNKPIDYDELVEFFYEKGIDGLNNGLDEADNRRLFETIRIPEMISLVLKGLGNKFENL